MPHRSRIAIAALIVLGVVTTAAADPGIEERSVTLRAEPDGNPRALYGEIRSVAERECRTHAVVAHRHARHERGCREEFIADAVRAFDRPELTALHEAETGAREGMQVATRS